MKTLGISAFYHDSAAVLLDDGKLVAAAQEERFTRVKHDPAFPENAVRYCLEEAGIAIDDIDNIAFYDKPLLKFERILSTYSYMFPLSLGAFWKAIPVWLKQKLWVPSEIRRHTDFQGDIYFTEHHESHAASSYFYSKYKESNILTIDGVGEWATATRGFGKDGKIDLWDEVKFPHSLGLLYSAITYFLGFKVNSAEYKVMGLAPYGEPAYLDSFNELISIYEDGSFHLNMDYFTYHHGLRMTGKRLEKLFGIPRRQSEAEPLEQVHKDIAMSLQRITEDVVLAMTRAMVKKTGNKNLCLAGGVALNCVANGRILRETDIENIFIQPAAGDAGGALGAAAFVQHQLFEIPQPGDFDTVYFGPGYGKEEIETYLKGKGASFAHLNDTTLLAETTKALTDQKVVGWFQGKMEFGPRALGNRSILADPRHAENRDKVNLKIKFRESFRPFAPTILEEHVNEYFALDQPSPYMLLVDHIQPGKEVLPAVTHVDGSARIQTINREQNPKYYDLIKTFANATGVPVVINTSFNVRGEPIVCTPEDALRCFMTTNMDVLVLDNYILYKEDNKNLESVFESQVKKD
jgi:carbamoyltransferase